MLWGVVNGACNIVEKRLDTNKLYKRTPQVVKWLATMVITYFCWQLFRAPDIATAARWIFSMFGLVDYANIPYTWQYFFDRQIVVFAVIGCLGATVFGLPKIQGIYNKVTATKVGYLVNSLVICLLFVLALMFMVNSTYSPFLYFQY